jgi:hypothetical protein
VDEIIQWFENEFGRLGFSLTPTIYNPDTFMPMKGVLFRHPQVNGGNTFKTTIRFLPEFIDHNDTEFKEIFRETVNQFLNQHGLSISGLKDFKPIKKISKLKL